MGAELLDRVARELETAFEAVAQGQLAGVLAALDGGGRSWGRRSATGAGRVGASTGDGGQQVPTFPAPVSATSVAG